MKPDILKILSPIFIEFMVISRLVNFFIKYVLGKKIVRGEKKG